MTGETWNSCRGDLAGKCVNYSQDAVDPVIEFGFIAVPVVTYLAAIIISRDFSN